MKAVLLKSRDGGNGLAVRIEEVAVPKLGDGDLLVRMRECGLCRTDIEKLKGEYTASMPVLGHEPVGVVSSLGDGVNRFKEGDRVFPHHHVSCGVCHYCRSGSETMCDSYRSSNLDPGGFSELFRVPSLNVSRGGVISIPAEMTDDEATLIEPAGCSLRAHSRSGIQDEDSVLVVGAGPVGMIHALLLKARGNRVAVSDVSEHRLAFAEKVGVVAVDASRKDVTDSVRTMNDGRGADVVIVAAGSQNAIDQAFKSVRKGGTVCIFGLPARGVVLGKSASDVFNSEVSVVASYGATEAETTKAVEVLTAKRVDFKALVTRRFPLDEFQSAVEAAEGLSEMKVVLTA